MSKPFCGGRHTSGALPVRRAAIETGGFRQRRSEAEPLGQTTREYALRGMLAGLPERLKEHSWLCLVCDEGRKDSCERRNLQVGLGVWIEKDPVEVRDDSSLVTPALLRSRDVWSV